MASDEVKYSFGQILDMAELEHIQAFASKYNLDATDSNIREIIVQKLASHNLLRDDDQDLSKSSNFNNFLLMSVDQLSDYTKAKGPKSQLLRQAIKKSANGNRISSPRVASMNIMPSSSTQSTPLNNDQIPIKTQIPNAIVGQNLQQLTIMPQSITESNTTAPVAAVGAIQPSPQYSVPVTSSQPGQSYPTAQPLVNHPQQKFQQPTLNQQSVPGSSSQGPTPTNATNHTNVTRLYESQIAPTNGTTSLMVHHPTNKDIVYIALMSTLYEFSLKKAQLTTMPILDLVDDVSASDQYLIIDVAFHPNYDVNHIIYVSYCSPTTAADCKLGWTHAQTVSKFVVSDDSGYITKQSEQVLMSVNFKTYFNLGGALALGPISKGQQTLYWSIGDDNDPVRSRPNSGYEHGKLWQIYPDSLEQVAVVVGLSNPVDIYQQDQQYFIVNTCKNGQQSHGDVIIRFSSSLDCMWPAQAGNVVLDSQWLESINNSADQYRPVTGADIVQHCNFGEDNISRINVVNGNLVGITFNGRIYYLNSESTATQVDITPSVNVDGQLLSLAEYMYVPERSQLCVYNGKMYAVINSNLYQLAFNPVLTDSDIKIIMNSALTAAAQVPSAFRKIPDQQVKVTICIYNGQNENYLIWKASDDVWSISDDEIKSKAFLAYKYSSNGNAMTTKDLTYLIDSKIMKGVATSELVAGFGGVPLYKADSNGMPILIGSVAVAGDGNEQNEYIAQAAAVNFDAHPIIKLPYE